MKDFLDIKIGDKVVVYDEYKHDYDEHCIQIESIEYDECNITNTNPQGMICYGKDLDWWDDYITNVTESNFIRFEN